MSLPSVEAIVNILSQTPAGAVLPLQRLADVAQRAHGPVVQAYDDRRKRDRYNSQLSGQPIPKTGKELLETFDGTPYATVAQNARRQLERIYSHDVSNWVAHATYQDWIDLFSSMPHVQYMNDYVNYEPHILRLIHQGDFPPSIGPDAGSTVSASQAVRAFLRWYDPLVKSGQATYAYNKFRKGQMELGALGEYGHALVRYLKDLGKVPENQAQLEALIPEMRRLLAVAESTNGGKIAMAFGLMRDAEFILDSKPSPEQIEVAGAFLADVDAIASRLDTDINRHRLMKFRDELKAKFQKMRPVQSQKCNERQGSVCEVVRPRKNPRRNPNCNQEHIYDSEGRKYTVVYRVVAAALDGSTVVTSNKPVSFRSQFEPPISYPREFQTRDLATPAEMSKIVDISRRLDPERLLNKHQDPTLGPPVVWPHEGKLFVLGGNGRTMAFLMADQEAYQKYLEYAHCKWDCFPTEPAPKGTRWMLVREVEGASYTQAVQLAAASQRSTAAAETRLSEAEGMMRSLQLNESNLPTVWWLSSIFGDNLDEFLADKEMPCGLPSTTNQVFFRYVFKNLDEAKRLRITKEPSLAADMIQNVFIGMLPKEAKNPELYEDRRVIDALVGASAPVLTTHLLARDERIPAKYDLWEALKGAVPVFQTLMELKPTTKKLVEILTEQANQPSLYTGRQMVEAPALSWALALAIWGAGKTLAPEGKIADYLKPYFDMLDRNFGPQLSMFRGPPPDPADVLGEKVPMYSQVAQVLNKFMKRNPLLINKGVMPVFALALDADKLSPHHPMSLTFNAPISISNIREFQERNPEFYRFAVKGMRSDKWEDAVNAVNVALLSVFRDDKMRLYALSVPQQRNVVATLPILAALKLAAMRGEIPETMDPAHTFPEGPDRAFLAANTRAAVDTVMQYAERAYRNDPRQAMLFGFRNPKHRRA
jgi:hypothetical protein